MCAVSTLVVLLILMDVSNCKSAGERDDVLSPEQSHTANNSDVNEVIQVLNKQELHCNTLKKLFHKLLFKIHSILPSTWVSETARNNTQRYLDDCLKLDSGMQPTSRIGLLANVIRGGFVYPGTKWCGSRPRASMDSDLGEANTTDICCRKHHRVNETLKAFGKGYGILNLKPYKMHNCVDDYKFYQCLLQDRSVPSEEYGQLYFDYLQPKCFVYAHPLKCKTWGSYNFWKMRWDCLEYELDKSKEETWQTFPAPHFFQEYKWKWDATRPAPDVGDTWKLVEFYDRDAIVGNDTNQYDGNLKDLSARTADL